MEARAVFIDINNSFIDINKSFTDIYKSFIDINKDGCKTHIYIYNSAANVLNVNTG